MDSKYICNTVDEYISAQEIHLQPLLERIRSIIKSEAPSALEYISYGMPAFKIHSTLVYFAANKKHIGFYPTSSPIVVFENELTIYKTSKGAIQFPLNQELPEQLIKKIVEFRVKEDEANHTKKRIKK